MATAMAREQSGRYNDALRWVSRTRATLAGRTDPDSLVVRSRASAFAASARYRQGRFNAAIRWSKRAATEALAAGDRRNHARALEVGAICSAYLGLPWSDETFEYSLAVYDEIGDLMAKAVALNRYGACAYFAGRWDHAVDLYIQAEHAFWRVGRDVDAVMNAANRAEVLIGQGRVADIDEILEVAARVWRGAGNTGALSFGLTLMGRAELIRGDYDEALGHLAEARRLSEEIGETDEIATIDGLRALAYLRRGDVSEALEVVIAALADEVATGGPATPMLERVRGEALIASGAAAAGYAALRDSLEDARRRGARPEIAETLEALLRLNAPASSVERADWRAERAAIVKALGIITSQDPAA
jgi:tetratricopeptide (TPR) repeat protein